MENNTVLDPEVAHQQVITPEELLAHWQGHRKLTRRVIEAFPEDKLFNFSIGGMRPFSMLALEILDMAAPTARGVVTGEWTDINELAHIAKKAVPTTRQEILDSWDEATGVINQYMSQVPAEKFHDPVKAFNTYDGTIQSIVLYVIDNEIHHRAQGYVYLRALGVEPPPFWDR